MHHVLDGVAAGLFPMSMAKISFVGLNLQNKAPSKRKLRGRNRCFLD